MQTKPKTPSEIKAIRESGRMLATVLGYLIANVAIGMSTKQIADLARTEISKLGGEPAFLNYQGFPDVLCTSVNNEVVHGIPRTDKIIQNGDLLSLDFGVKYRGMITDAARTVIVGKPKDKSQVDFVENTRRSLLEGLAVVKDGVRVGDIGHAIEKYLNRFGYGIVRDLVGHGVGHYLHEDPNIPNYGRPHTGPWLKKNMTIAIEPMTTMGRDDIMVSKDDWTILTRDNSLAAHFEDTVLITEQGCEILSQDLLR